MTRVAVITPILPVPQDRTRVMGVLFGSARYRAVRRHVPRCAPVK